MNTNDTNGGDPSMGEPVNSEGNSVPAGPQEYWIIQYLVNNERLGHMVRKDVVCSSRERAHRIAQRLGLPPVSSPFYRIVHVREVVV